MTLPTEPGIYRDRYGLPWIMHIENTLYDVETMMLIPYEPEYIWRFGDEVHNNDTIETKFGPFVLMLPVTERWHISSNLNPERTSTDPWGEKFVYHKQHVLAEEPQQIDKDEFYTIFGEQGGHE